MSYLDDEEEDEIDHEDPDPSDQDVSDGDTPDEAPCPNCGAMIYEMAEFCPRCKQYISWNDPANQPRPVWKILVVVLLVLMLSGLIYFLRK